MLLQHLLHEDHIAERLGHLLAVEVNHADVHPAAHERRTATGGFCLGDLGGMVREDQVGATAMNVDLGSKKMRSDRRALDVPAWASRSPWAGPAWLGRGGWLPEHEIQRIALLRVV